MSETAAQQSFPNNPYVGPVPFLEGQTLYGRVKETDALYNLLISKRIVLLFSPSGAGKTSLIQAALLPRLRSRLNPLPIVRLDRILSANAKDRPANSYLLSAFHSIESRFPQADRLKDEQLSGLTFGGYLSQRLAALKGNETGKFPLIVLDQFEELFTLSRFDWKEKEDFLKQLGQVLGGSTERNGNQEGVEEKLEIPPIWALLSMREDYMAELDPFLDLIPTGLAFRFRLEPLERDQAIEAVRGPAGKYFPNDAAELLVDNLRKLRAQTPTGEEKWEEGRFVEPVHLQVVCQRLWDKVVKAEQRAIKPDDVGLSKQKSEVDAALSDYYDLEIEDAAHKTGIRQRDLRDWIQEHLITRTKIRTKTLRDLNAMGKLDEAVKLLVKGHVLRIDVSGDREWIELPHDRLINPVLKSNEAWREKHLALVQKQAKLWSEAGKSKRELLFSGEELDAAEKFAQEHPDDMDQDDKEFLEASRLERERVLEDKRKKEQIEEKNKQLNEKNEQLMSQRLKLAAISVLMIIVAAAAIYWGWENRIIKEDITQKNDELKETNIKLENSLEDYKRLLSKNRAVEHSLVKSLSSSRLLQAVASAAKGRGIEALNVLLQARETIEEKKLDEQRTKFEQSLLEVMGKLPPVILEVGEHSPIARVVQFSADGKFLFSGGWDEKLKIWPLEPKGKERVIDEHRSNIYSLAYHDASKILASSDQEGLVIIWRVSDGRPERVSQLTRDQSGHKKEVTSLALNSDGSLLATAGMDKSIVLWNVSDPASPIKIASFGNYFHQAPIYRVLFIEAGKNAGKLVSADFNGSVGIWSMPKSGSADIKRPDIALTTKDVKQHEVAISSMAASPDGRWLSVGDFDGDVLIWDLESANLKLSGKRLNPKLSHKGPVFGMAFSPSGKSLVTVGSDEVLVKWDFPSAPQNVTDLEKNLRVRKIEGWGEKLYCVSFHPKRDGTVVVGGTKSVRMAYLEPLNPITNYLGTVGRAAPAWHAVAMTPDSTLLAALTSDQKQIYFWRSSAEGYKPVENLTINSALRFAGISIHPSGQSLATLTCEGELAIWQLPETGSPSSAGLRKEAPQTGRCPTAALSFSRDGKMLADAIKTKLNLWTDPGSGNWQSRELASLDKPIQCVAFSAKDDLLAAAGEFERIMLWEIADGQAKLLNIPSREILLESVQALAFRPDGRTLVTGGTDFIVREWKLPNLEKGGQSALHKRAVTSLSFGLRKDLPVLFSADREGQIVACLGGISDEECVHIGWPRGRPIFSLATSADSNRLVEAGEGLWVWNLSFDAMLKIAENLAGGEQ